MRTIRLVRPAIAAALLSATLALAAGGSALAAPNQTADCGGPYSGVTGQPVTMKASLPPLRGVIVYNWDYGDGAVGFNNPTTHTYTRPGTFTVDLKAVSSTLDEASCSTSVTIGGGAVATPTPQTTGPIGTPGAISGASGSTMVTYAAGWNLIAGPTGTSFPAAGPLFTLQDGDSAYETLDPGQAVSGGEGYWAYFASPTTLAAFTTVGSTHVSVPAPAGLWIMIGDPSGTSSVTLHGADMVFTYDAVQGSYVPTTTLAPGQGAWALSLTGGTIEVGP